MIAPIQTRYANCNFRSRLEARWAVYFDAMGIKWEYEKEGYRLSDGECYLPDFWFPTAKMWAEVKPENGFDAKTLDKLKKFQNQMNELEGDPHGNWIIMLEGLPEFKTYLPANGKCEVTLALFKTGCLYFGPPEHYSQEIRFAIQQALSKRFEF